MESRKRTTIKTRLTGFFAAVSGFSFLMVLLSLFFLFYSLHSYQNVYAQISECSQSAELVKNSLQQIDFYLTAADEKYYENSTDMTDLASEIVRTLQEGTHETSLGRQLQDIGEMLESLKIQQKNIHEEMYRYSQGDLASYVKAAGYSKTAQKIENGLTERFHAVQQLIMQEVNSFEGRMMLFLRQILVCFLLLLCLNGVSAAAQLRDVTMAVTNPVQELIQKAGAVHSNMMTEIREPVTVSERSDDDLKDLTEVFNEMLRKIGEQIDAVEENARIRQELTESRFKELQMQINPHFLFNTLNMVAEKAYLENADETAELLENIAEMFRYSLDFSGKIVSLQKELEELGNYVMIQEQRYGKRIRFRFDLEEAYHEVSLPALTLQPLVENAIIHGVGMRTENGLIRISSAYEPEKRTVLLTVEDNGDGMTEETRVTVESQMENYSGEGMKVGLGNVYLRLKMYYEGRAQMWIESRIHQGTSIRIRLPFGEQAGEENRECTG